MASKYYAIVTDLGTNKMLRAIKEGKKVNVTHIAVGDGEGEYYQPTADMTALKNELWRGEVNSCRISEESENLLIIESVIPSDAGGFTVREMAAFDEEGVMIAICNTPDTQKVRVSDGVAHELKLAIEVALSNTDSVQLIIDPNVVTATKKDIEELRIAFEKELEAQKNMGTTGAYRENVKYKVGDYCLYENNLYKCLQDTEGEWDPDCWQQTSPLEEIEQLRGTINSLAMIIGKDEEGNLRQLGEAAFAGISHNFLTEENNMVAGADLLKLLKDQVDAQNSASVLENLRGSYVYKHRTGKDSFVNAAGAHNIVPGMLIALDQIQASIASYNSGIHQEFYEEGHINYQVVLSKYSNDYYAGIIMSSHMYSESYLPIFFSYANGGKYSLFIPEKIT